MSLPHNRAGESGAAKLAPRSVTCAPDQGDLCDLLDRAPLPMCVVTDRTIRHANVALEVLLNEGPGTLSGRPIDSLACRSDSMLVADGKPQAIRHAAGRILWAVLRTGSPDAHGRTIWTFEDASDFQALRQELSRSRSRVSDEVGRKTIRIRETNKEYRRELKRLSVFDVGLTQSREKYRVLFQNSQTGIAFVDDSGMISQTNPALRSMLRVRNMVEYRRIAQQQICLCNSFDKSVSLAELARHLVQDMIGERALLFTFEMPGREPRQIEMRCVRMHVRDFSAALTFTDRTDEFLIQRRDAEQRRQVNRMGRISLAGHLGSAAAHELGQPLHVCMNYIGGLNQRLDTGDVTSSQIRHALAKIETELDRARSVIKNMRRFVSNHQPEDQEVCFADLLDTTLGMMASNFRESNAAVSVHRLTDQDLTFCGNSIEIQQVLVNLILNSLDAMRECMINRPEIMISVRVNDEQQIECLLQDSGPGISESVYDQLFTPYCTNKADGLGLGLAMSRNIIESHGGKIWAVNAPVRGATFVFTLPAMARA